jgi:hypothetical protein
MYMNFFILFFIYLVCNLFPGVYMATLPQHARKAYSAIPLYKLGKSNLLSFNFSLLLTTTTVNLYFNFKGLSLILSGSYTSLQLGSIRF